jgi:hypothetical protein
MEFYNLVSNVFYWEEWKNLISKMLLKK